MTCFLAQAVSLMFPLLTAIPISATIEFLPFRAGGAEGGWGLYSTKLRVEARPRGTTFKFVTCLT